MTPGTCLSATGPGRLEKLRSPQRHRRLLGREPQMERPELWTLPCVSPRKVHLKWSQSRYKMKKDRQLPNRSKVPHSALPGSCNHLLPNAPQTTAFGSPQTPVSACGNPKERLALSSIYKPAREKNLRSAVSPAGPGNGMNEVTCSGEERAHICATRTNLGENASGF